MRLRLLKVPKTKKLNLKKIERSKTNITAKKVLVFVIALLVLVLLAGSGIAGDIWKDKLPKEKKAEPVHEEPSEENEKTEASVPEDMKNRLAADFISTLTAEEYLIRYKTTTVYQGQSYEVETTYAVSGHSIALASTDRATVVKDNRVYMLNHADKSMISWNVTESDYLERIETEGLVYQGSSNTGGLVCEEYKTAETQLKIYFEGKELKKVATSINDQDVMMDIIEVSKKVPESLFAVPQDYRNTNLSNATGSQ